MPGQPTARTGPHVRGGAGGIRAEGPDDIAAIRALTKLPIIGIAKVWDDRFPVYITPGFDDAVQIARAGADIIGLDATAPAERGADGAIGCLLRDELGREVFADIATLDKAMAAHAYGATYVTSTLSGYTEETVVRKGEGPDLELLEALVAALPVPVVAEGRSDTLELVTEAFRRGAHAVVVGTAITTPREITKKFVRAVEAWNA